MATTETQRALDKLARDRSPPDLLSALRLIQDDERVDFHARATCEAAADEIERLLAACKDKTILLKDAYAKLEQ